MRKVLSLLVAMLIVGFSVSSATFSGYVVAATSGTKSSVYDAFWEILNREAELVPKAQRGNLSAINELIKNSRDGSENAAQISALVWEALTELKASGVKLHYTESELRAMAQEIKRKGLPQETVNALKEQGWSDEEIQALQDYIVQNADYIHGDFDMEKFLSDFSTAFLRVAFRYNEYETKGLEWKYWRGADGNPSLAGNRVILPQLLMGWVNFYTAYRSGGVDDKLYAIQKLKQEELNIISGKLDSNTSMVRVSGGYIVITKFLGGPSPSPPRPEPTPIKPIKPIIKPTSSSESLNSCKIEYTWNALKAYNLTLQVESILLAKKAGNSNPELTYMLNEKVSQLADALKTYTRSSGCMGVLPSPIGPISVAGEGGPLVEEALAAGEEGRLVVTSIYVVPVTTTADYATYKVVVEIKAEKNAVSNIEVEFSGTELEDSESVGFLYKDEITTVESTNSGRVYGTGSVLVSGTVKITYKPSSGDTPLSTDSEYSLTSTRLIEVSYSATITLEDPIDPGKVQASLLIQDSDRDGSFEEGEDLTFKAVVTNYNSEPISGSCMLEVEVPQTSTSRGIYRPSGGFDAPGNGGSDTVTLGSAHYAYSGSYSYTMKCSFGQHSKILSGYFVVSKGSTSSGSLQIVGVTRSPETVKSGEQLTFKVNVENSYTQSKTVKLKLLIDGKVVDSVSGSVPASSTKSFTLQWTAVQGEHSYEVRLFEVLGGQELEVDGWSGEVSVASQYQQFAVSLEAFPTELEGGGTVFFTVRIWNFDSSAISVRGFVEDESGAIIKRIDGFEGGVPANGGRNVSFSYTIHGVGNHAFKLFLDNYDGEPNGAGEEHWAEVTVKVKPVNGTELKQVGFECSDLYFTKLVTGVNLESIKNVLINYQAEVECVAIIYNPTDEKIKIDGLDIGDATAAPTALNVGLKKFKGKISSDIIVPQSYITIQFMSIAEVPLAVLEGGLWGSTYYVELPYNLNTSHGTFKFKGYGSGRITQNNKVVTVDIAVTLIFLKGSNKVIVWARNAIEYSRRVFGYLDYFTGE
ncbi:MAG: hypothetical protein PWQ79_159 [Thermococcaceae archaeon]|nr:hypothetical protein [Thermococcaceae archaeon]